MQVVKNIEIVFSPKSWRKFGADPSCHFREISQKHTI